MNNKTTKVFVALAIGLFAYIFFFERHQDSTESEAALHRKLLPGFSGSLVTSVDIIQSNKAIISVEKAGESWRMTSPVHYPADALALEGLLSALQKVEQMSFISPSEIAKQGGKLIAYGLENPPATIVIHEGTRRTELRLGIAEGVGTRIYCQVAGAQGVAVVAAEIAKHVPLVADFWRDRGVLSLEGRPFDRILLKSGARSLEFERESGVRIWSVIRPLKARADSARVADLIVQASTARVIQFVSDGRSDLDPMGLQTPDLELSFARGTNVIGGIAFGRAATNSNDAVFALLSGGTNVVLVSNELARRARALMTDFRDTRLATIPAADVDRIEFTGDEHVVLQQSGTNGWRILEPQPMPADSGLVRNVLAALGTIEIVEFVKDVVTDYSGYGLARPALTYSLFRSGTNGTTVATNAPLLRLDFGKIEGENIFTRRGDEYSVYAVGSNILARLPKSAFELRDRRVWDFASSNILGFEIFTSGPPRKFVRNAAQAWSNGPMLVETIEAAKLEDVIGRLGELRADAWTARGDNQLLDYGISAESFRLTFELRAGEKSQILEIQFGRLAPNRRRYAAVKLDGQTVIFEFPARLWDDLRDVANSLIVMRPP